MDKIEKVSLVDEAYKRIKEYLLTGDFSEGQKIPSENQLCKDLSVSRVVVREALSKLRSNRLIVTYQGKGSFIANPVNFSSEDLGISGKIDFNIYVKVMEFREAIEFAAINYATKYATDEELQAIKEIALEMEKVNINNNFTLLDYEFHSKIVSCSHNPFLISSHESCKEMILTALECMNVLDGSYDYAISLHKKIVDCLLAREPKSAISLYKNNGEYNIARMQEFFANKK